MAWAGFDQSNERVRQLDLVESQAERRGITLEGMYDRLVEHLRERIAVSIVP
jgi:hypothetical protein